MGRTMSLKIGDKEQHMFVAGGNDVPSAHVGSTRNIIKILGDPNEQPYFPYKKEAVDHPDHYGGKDNPYEAIKIIRHFKLGFSLGNTIKYILRAGKKDPNKYLEDLKKAAWYLNEEINEFERSIGSTSKDR